MRLLESVRQRVMHFFGAPLEELSSWARLVRFQVHLWGFCVNRLRRNNAMAMSAALSFRTIFAMVPTIILTFLLLKSLGFVEDGKRLLNQLMHESGLTDIAYVEPDPEAELLGPGAGVWAEEEMSVAAKLESLIGRVEEKMTVGALGPIGVALMIWTALTLLTTVERSLNRIFEATRPRSLGRRVLVYWSALTLGPLALVTVTFAANKAAEAVSDIAVLSWLLGAVMWAAPVLLGIGLLAALYSLMPNTHVSYRAALAGALVSVPFWLVARWAFSIYVRNVGLHSLYGAIALVPLFLLWTNLSWWIFLFGAQIAHTIEYAVRLGAAWPGQDEVLTAWHTVGALVAVALRRAVSDRPVPVQDVAKALGLSYDTAGKLLGQLESAGLVCRVAGGGPAAYVSLKDVSKIRLADVLQTSLDDRRGIVRHWDRDVAAIVDKLRSRVGSGIADVTLAGVLSAEATCTGDVNDET